MERFGCLSTYKEVAEEYGFNDELTRIYVEYMTTRWGAKEGLHCKTGYASEWARRFQNDDAYNASDANGKIVLKSIAPHLCK